MSVRVMGWVWEHSQSKSTERLVLLAIADCAADDGANAYPSMAKLVAKTGLTDRGIQKALVRLEALGELVVSRNAGPRGCNRYRVRMATPEPGSSPNDVHPPEPSTDEPSSPPEPRSPLTPNTVHPDPEPRSPGTILEPSKEPSERRASPKKALAIPDRSDVETVCRHLADRIEANGSRRPTITPAWRDAARRLIDRDGRTVDQIIRAIDWCQDDSFWKANVLSMPKLREQYDRLRLAAGRTNGHKPSTSDQRVMAAQALKAKFAGES